MTSNAIQLMPYLHFSGECEEALNAYQQILGGEIQVVNRYDNPAMNAPEDYKNKILHAVFTFSGNTIFASDTMPGKSITRGTGDVALSLSFPTPEEGQRAFDALAAIGKVQIPFKKQFWGAWHGNLTDQFGIRWMVNA
jgi:PhnB protein